LGLAFTIAMGASLSPVAVNSGAAAGPLGADRSTLELATLPIFGLAAGLLIVVNTLALSVTSPEGTSPVGPNPVASAARDEGMERDKDIEDGRGDADTGWDA
jgi:hypothetical protein